MMKKKFKENSVFFKENEKKTFKASGFETQTEPQHTYVHFVQYLHC